MGWKKPGIKCKKSQKFAKSSCRSTFCFVAKTSADNVILQIFDIFSHDFSLFSTRLTLFRHKNSIGLKKDWIHVRKCQKCSKSSCRLMFSQRNKTLQKIPLCKEDKILFASLLKIEKIQKAKLNFFFSQILWDWHRSSVSFSSKKEKRAEKRRFETRSSNLVRREISKKFSTAFLVLSLVCN